jgi:hypothetical protein
MSVTTPIWKGPNHGFTNLVIKHYNTIKYGWSPTATYPVALLD